MSLQGIILAPQVRRKQEIAADSLGCLRGGRSLFQLYEILARVHSLLVLDEEPGDRAVLFRLDLVEGLHDLDQADGVPSRDAVALLHVDFTLRVGTAVESTWHLSFQGLVCQFPS